MQTTHPNYVRITLTMLTIIRLYVTQRIHEHTHGLHIQRIHERRHGLPIQRIHEHTHGLHIQRIHEHLHGLHIQRIHEHIHGLHIHKHMRMCVLTDRRVGRLGVGQHSHLFRYLKEVPYLQMSNVCVVYLCYHQRAPQKYS